MKGKLLGLGVTLLASLWVSEGAYPAVIYDSGAGPGGAIVSDSNTPPQYAADNFQLVSGATTITDVHWTGVYGVYVSQGSYTSGTVPANDDFTIEIYEGSSGVPNSTPSIVAQQSGSIVRQSTGVTIGSYKIPLYSYAVDIGPVTLTAGTSYWISIYSNTTFNTDDLTRWLWTFGDGSDSTDTIFWRTATDGSWDTLSSTPYGLSLDFALTGIPEPATLALFGVGVAGIPFVRRLRTPA